MTPMEQAVMKELAECEEGITDILAMIDNKPREQFTPTAVVECIRVIAWRLQRRLEAFHNSY